ncbi:Serine/threonine-protein kinase PK-1 [Acidipropionibacterium virtanenii]|uniref:non-specific serine/threonine protein kinase n=2 Tax=Acidipropionibacterium virtanenii TaxID=2057246 RepID=A0A344UVC5_9ACTN|nr:protein kinase [Acidipropionibacterium virtanenii]AXE39223.1 Serine/threonine-protein kinase PK-1 [Acidipropionibacterium virtanenii]
MTVSTDPLVGRVLGGRYEITSRIARGGMATVYRAQDVHLHRGVAVKVMHEGLYEDPEFARRFDLEAKAAARLVNPHVVSVFDQGVDDLRPYIVMEYVPGCTLRHVIVQDAPLTPRRALALLEPVVSALASAHDDGVVHRDVKPENVLISDRGQIKVADFGLARAVTAQSVTATGLLVGTVSYLPPELVVSNRADERSDVYSTGIVLFEMLTGHKPHTGETPIQVAWAHVHEDVPAPSAYLAGLGRRGRELAEHIPAYLDALVRSCTAREPADRPVDGRVLLGLIRSARVSLAQGRAEDPAITSLMHRAGSAQPASPVPVPGASPAHTRTPVSPIDRPAVSRVTPARPGVAIRTDISHRAASPQTPRDTPRPRNPGVARAPHTRPTGPGRVTRSAPRGRRPAPYRGRRNLIAMLLITVLAVAVGLTAYRFGVSLRTSSGPAAGQVDVMPPATSSVTVQHLEDSPHIR